MMKAFLVASSCLELGISAGLRLSQHVESDLNRFGNLEASVRSCDTDAAKRADGDLIEAGLN
jgi:hypothetical protein